MNFPGDNTITLTSETVKAILHEHMSGLLGDGVLIKCVERDGYYGSVALKVTFTTDALVERALRPAFEPAPLV